MPAFAPDESPLEVRWAVDNSVVVAEDVAVDLLEDNIAIPGLTGVARLTTMQPRRTGAHLAREFGMFCWWDLHMLWCRSR